MPGIKEENKDYLKGAVRWYRCKKCREWVPETATECARCGEPFADRIENEEIEITIEIEPFPGATHLRKKLIIKPKTSTQTIISKLIGDGIINEGKYDEVGIIRVNNTECASSVTPDGENCWQQYPDYQSGDIVLIKRQLTFTEMALAHLSYIQKKYSDDQLFSECNLTVILPQKMIFPRKFS